MSDMSHFKEKEHEDHRAMSPLNLLNALFLCAVNALFMIAGIFLNSVVNKSMEITNWKEAMLLYDWYLIMF